ncbi:Sexual differentiation process protein isp4 [Neolecta irregularis DAH-3]|uniref:Sexual differentiation process protein isp4 n=1 Tax=Neolecta irregularis (strain DAH-3) TaxID=1198029 RepID=A0A1U7LLE1_NEOID|nr:Sexual differentiation process protein isp4 [Neolecta irregularis DAH-3]|eukprot:OLL23475.1 Sexual differentiation process protein isp4 [Neolecta irregularis DAH-3]
MKGKSLLSKVSRSAATKNFFSAAEYHDPNLPKSSCKKDTECPFLEEEYGGEAHPSDSPYPEVRAAISNVDDPAMPVATIRMWVIGIMLVVAGTSLNTLFLLREPVFVIGPFIALLIAYPCGRLWERVMPTHTFTTFGYRWSLNPGPFNYKEHTLITIMANASFSGVAMAVEVILTQRIHFSQSFGLAFEIMLTVSSQLIGLAFAGLSRRFLVYPASVIWPVILVPAALLQTLHQNTNYIANGWKVTRHRFFLYVFFAGFIWYWFPGYLFTALSSMAVVTWIWPRNVLVNQIFGAFHGLDLLPFTFDWGQIAGNGLSPLNTPWWAHANVLGAFIFWCWIVTPLLHFSNNQYDVYQILTPETTLDLRKYKSYSPLFLSTSVALYYAMGFANITSALIHTLIYHREDIFQHFRKSHKQHIDIHSQLMRNYREVPYWWYSFLGIIAFVMAVAVCEIWDSQLPWWGLGLSLLFAMIFFLPYGFVQGITNLSIATPTLFQLICGYLLPGRPVANALFKTYGYVAICGGLETVSSLKFGHYMKIPPRTLFSVQVSAILISCFIQIAIVLWSLDNIKGICTEAAVNNFTCPDTYAYFHAAIIWGVIGPQRLFGAGQIYHCLLYFLLLGALAPIIVHFFAKRFAKNWMHMIYTPLFFGALLVPPLTARNYISWSVVGFIFNYVVKRRFLSWWSKYNYVLSAALDTSMLFAALAIFLCTSLLGSQPSYWTNWWGNNVAYDTEDFVATPLVKLREGEIFGPRVW